MIIGKRKPTFIEAFIPVLFLIVFLSFNVAVFKEDALAGSNQMVLILSATVAAGISLRLGIKWKDLREGIVRTISSALPSILILLLIGSLAGTWLLSGVVPAMIYYGLKILNPTISFEDSLIKYRDREMPLIYRGGSFTASHSFICDGYQDLSFFHFNWGWYGFLDGYFKIDNLNPGNYTFRVKAANNDGIWNEEGVALKVIVRPPWWKTVLFRLIVLVLVIVLIYSLYLYRVSSLKRQKTLLEQQVEERTREINEKSNLLQMQAEELGKINALLEERNRQIESQAEGLSEANALLEERQQQIEDHVAATFKKFTGEQKLSLTRLYLAVWAEVKISEIEK